MKVCREGNFRLFLSCLLFLTNFMISKLLLKYWLRQDAEFGVLLGPVQQKGSPIAFLKSEKIWKQEPFTKKIKSLLFFRWTPTEDLLERVSREVFYEDVFGYPTDYNENLFRINHWHNSRLWDLSSLTTDDEKKADSLVALSVLLKTKHRRLTSNHLHLHLFEKAPMICTLLHPMVVKIPVTSIQYCVEIHNAFAFNEIRISKILHLDDIINYIYELQNLQLKTALSLQELIYLIDYNEKNKGEALLIQAELSAISEAEIVISYLKASIEKIVVLLGLLFNLKNLETKKTHKDKLTALYKVIPANVKPLYYFELIEELIKSESLEELNSYRTGLLHKKGISKLQPHSFIGKNAKDVPLREVFLFLIEQHSKNSAVIISTYALLTDKLVELKRPNIKLEDLPL
jgi:hypothetical protein